MTSCLANPGKSAFTTREPFPRLHRRVAASSAVGGTLRGGVSGQQRGFFWTAIVPASRGQLAAPVSIAALCCPSEHTGSVAGTLLRLPRAPGGPRQARVKACGDSSRWRGDSGAPPPASPSLRLPPPASACTRRCNGCIQMLQERSPDRWC